MEWHVFDVLSMIGTVAFAVSGAVVAMEEEYDVLGVFVLGLVTAFGGGIVRNLLIGVPVTTLWSQKSLLTAAIISIAVVFVLPVAWIRHWRRSETFFDAIGLSAFAVQGALYATQQNHALPAVVVAAMLTGIGGGMIRDLLAGRKPLVLREEIYAVWAMGAGLVIGLGWADSTSEYLVLFTAVVACRMLSAHYKWRLPRRSLRHAFAESVHAVRPVPDGGENRKQSESEGADPS
ncbi:MAG: trimeric intracellular cation channel family protein [Thermobacillus sp.]|uniref:Putative membrane protein n=1 Tax=Thermobacillus composti (strain DSM 18247 / JCM 13945 / KWC4) TaxID=717605 RepID=L0EE21_THECK|nr:MULTISPECIES: trimeric intracellular cation channel family protein [Thermobacillus]AGA57854.1 putative membrane protein [Thermobacillus composti KWC4]REK56790.1 MAG: trimeric intracellular cation channel family protein [Thermobacillus sp.]